MSAVSHAKVEQTAIVWPDRALCSAAASVDVETDAKVQTMIRDVFGSCTVFAIAHRLVSAKPPATPSRAGAELSVGVGFGQGTIIDYDSILVLDKGHVIEAGNPASLLDNPDGRLSLLVDGTGAASAAHLRTVAYASVGRTGP